MNNTYIVNLSIDKSKINYYISSTLLKSIEENLEANRKIILYINKRWQFSSLICSNCSNLYKCPKCDISLSVHKNPSKLICHHCLYSQDIPNKCDKCNNTELKMIWVWTQQIEDVIKKEFNTKKVFRFDTDTTKNKTEKTKALKELEKADIIIGTKMITTGFDFKNLWLIGLILLEQELQIPEYNVEEKVYANIKQLIWRWWRKWQDTDILIQTFIPESEIIKDITSSNFKDFFIKTLKERKLFNYPPFCEMVTIKYKHKESIKAKDKLIKIKDKLDSLNTNKEYEITFIDSAIKRNNQFHYRLIIKWKQIRFFLENIKKYIFTDSNLSIIFE